MSFRYRWTKVRIYFRKTCPSLFTIANKELYVFLIFLGLSVLFWFLQSTQSISQTEISIPLKYKALPENIVINGELPPTLKFTITDKGSHLYTYTINRRRLALDIDLMQWSQEEGISRVPIKHLEQTLFAKLKPSAQILRIKPDSLIVRYEAKEQKDLPIKLNAQLDFSQQYMLIKEPSVQPASITVFAAASILDTLSTLETEPLVLSELKDSITLSVKLKKIAGVHYSQSSVKVHLPVEGFTEVHYDLPVLGQDFPSNMFLRSFPSKVTLSFLVNKSNYQLLTADDFKLGIHYKDIVDSKEDLLPVRLIKVPEYVQRLSLHPEKVECLIEKQ